MLTRSIIVLIAAVALCGCGSFGGPVAHPFQERCPKDPTWRDDPMRKSRPTPGNPVFLLSLTSQGEWADRCQLSDLLQELQGSPESLVVVLYVHGWKHGPESEDRERFSEFVETISIREEAFASKRSGRGPKARRVVGIYVGWPGQTVALPLLEELTYWGRQKAADRISQSGIVAKIVAAVRSVRQTGFTSSGPLPHSGDLYLFVGHSFGARILLTATAQMQIQELESNHPGTMEALTSMSTQLRRGRAPSPYGCIRGVATLMVLLNPAVEAFTYSPFQNVRRGDHVFNVGQQPVMLTIASENDWATRLAFPIGQTIGLNWHEKERATIGNFEAYATHRLTVKKICGGKSARWFDRFQSPLGVCMERLDAPAVDIEGVRNPNTDARFPVHAGNPFLVARASKEVIDGHNGLWRSRFTGWLADFTLTVDRERRENGCKHSR